MQQEECKPQEVEASEAVGVGSSPCQAKLNESGIYRCYEACKRNRPLAFARCITILSGGQVLSVETALSIQSHPDKALAQRLHAERPQVLPHTQPFTQ